MKKTNPAMKLPDALIVRYFRQYELDLVTKVVALGSVWTVTLKLNKGGRTDKWRDLGGGLGIVPDAD